MSAVGSWRVRNMGMVACAGLFALALSGLGCSGEEEGEPSGADAAATDGARGDTGAPQVAITAPGEGSLIQPGLVAFSATITDDRDDAVDLVVVWTSDLVGKLADGAVSAAGGVTNEIEFTLPGTHVITLTATDSDGNEGAASVTLEVNGLPEAPVVAITPESPGTKDDLTATLLEEATDPNRAPAELVYEYEWTRDGETMEGQSGPLIPAAETNRGEQWQVRVIAFDGFGYGEPGTAQVAIANTAPVCGQAAILPSSGTAATAFSCECVGREDADQGDPSVDMCVFYDDGDVMVAEVEAGPDGCVLDPGEVERGMELTCGYIPGDGQDEGDEVVSGPVVVMNALPSAPAVILTPAVGQVGTLFTCEVVEPSVDADGDALSYETTWVLNGYPNPGTSDASVVASQLVSDEDGTPASAGDELRCEVRAHDGLSPSVAGVSELVELQNSAPQGGSVVVVPAEVQEGGSLTCEASGAEDGDGEPVSWSFVWRVNGEVVEGQEGETLSSEHFDKGDTVLCEATPSDGALDGDPVVSKTSAEVMNTLPTLELVTLDPLTAMRKESFTCSHQGWADPDPADAEATVVWAWLLLGEDGVETPIPGEVSAELLAIGLSPGDEVRCQATPVNDDDAGEPVASLQTGVVVNALPTMDGATLTPSQAYADTLLTCEPGTLLDPDDDEVEVAYVWKLNGEILEEQTDSTLSGVFVKGDSVRCEATPQDGYGDGEPQLSDDVVIGNKLPAISDVTITPPYGALCDTFTCAPGDVLDPDVEDPIALSYAWTLNGEPADQAGEVWVGELLPEDELQCFITAWDGTLELAPPFDQVLTDPVGSNLAEIVNNPPTVQSVAIPEVDPAVGDTLTCTPVGFQDAECAPEPAYIYKWYVGGATLIDGAASETLVTWGMSEGDVISCQAIPFDGFDYGSPELSNEVVLGPEVIQCPDPFDAGACDDGDACTQDDACDAGSCAGVPVVCDDGDLCNGVETCDGVTGACLAGAPPVLDDGVDCTVDTCDPATGVKHVPDHAACNGGAPCTSYTCDPASGCEAAATDCCGDGVVEAGEDCDDGNNEPGDGCAPDCTAEPCASLRFEPTSYVDFGGAAELIQPSDELTFETWVRWSGGWAQLQNYAQVVVGTVSSHTSGGWNIALEEAERWQLNVRTDGDSVALGLELETATASQWVHLAATFQDGVATALFVNGEAVDSAPTEPLLFDGTEQLWMGNQADHADELRQFQGDVYSARLSSTVKYDGPFVPKPALGAEVDTIAYWDFSGVSPTTVPDASGQGHDGTRVGGTVVGGCPLAVDGAVCGDDVVAPWEECDDGNTEDDDGCSAACELPVTWLSCKHLLDSAPETQDGAYWIDPDAAGPVAPVRCFCDMTGGGWTLVGNYYDTPGDDMPNDTAYVVGGWEQMDSGQWADTATTVDRNAGPSAGVALAFVEALGAVGGQANLKICFIEEEGGDAPCRSSADGSLTLVSYDAGNPKLSPYSDDPLPYTYGRLAGLAGGADGYGAGVLDHKVACIPVTPSSNTILPGGDQEFGNGASGCGGDVDPGLCDLPDPGGDIVWHGFCGGASSRPGFTDVELLSIWSGHRVYVGPPVCGDGQVGGGEECDDGNLVAGDGCSESCKQEIACGNNVIEDSEKCDDGNTADADGCSSSCEWECPSATFAGNTYLFCSGPLSRGEAEASCLGAGMDLVRLETAEENQWVHDHATGVENWDASGPTILPWIGLSNPNGDGNWVWNDGADLTWVNWCTPGDVVANPDRQCAHMDLDVSLGDDTGCWGSNQNSGEASGCEQTWPFICERASSPSATDAVYSPDPCGGVDYVGVCLDNVVHWCEESALHTTDCGEMGLVCGLSQGIYMCSTSEALEETEAPDCEDLGVVGTCIGSEVHYCEDGQIQVLDCGVALGECTLLNGIYDCFYPDEDQAQSDEESFCADIGSTGTCLGSVLYFCDNAGDLQAYECGTAAGGYCTWTGPGVGYDCVEPGYTRPEEAPDVLLLGVSGHMKATSDLFEDANPEYLAASGTLNAVADVYTDQGLTVHSLPYADRFYDEVLDSGEPGAYGFLSLLDDLEFAYCNWIVHCDENGIPLGYIDNPTRIVVVAHSHGCVWAHTALWVSDWAPVEALISLDAVSMGWEGKVGGFGDNWASVILEYTEETNHEWPFAIWDPTDSWSVPGLNKLQDVEDLVPANVGVNIEVRSGGVVDFGDGEVNHRGNGSQFQIYEHKFPKEKHSKVDEVDSDALSWVIGLLGVLYGL